MCETILPGNTAIAQDAMHAASGELLMQFTPAVKVVELYYLARKPIGFRSRSAGEWSRPLEMLR